MRRLIFIAAVVAAAALGAGIVYAAVPGADSKVSFCYRAADASKPGGAAMYVIDPDAGGSCKAGQVASSVVSQGLVTGSSAGPGASGFSFPNSNTAFSTSVTTDRPTKLFVIGDAVSDITCSSTAYCGYTLMMHVDGQQVQETYRTVAGSAAGRSDAATAFAVVNVQAGTHVIEWRRINDGAIQDGSLSVHIAGVALGG